MVWPGAGSPGLGFWLTYRSGWPPVTSTWASEWLFPVRKSYRVQMSALLTRTSPGSAVLLSTSWNCLSSPASSGPSAQATQPAPKVGATPLLSVT